MTSVVMGPYASQILGDLGADVIKVEPPDGDTTRKLTPAKNQGMGHVFLNLNRNKRSVVLDLKKPDGLAALMRLAKDADAIIYNVRPNAMARLGITYEKLAAANPKLISLSLVGYGQDGPYAADPAYEDLIQGLTAVPSLLAEAGAEVPHYVPLAFNDRSVGLHAVIALLAAICRRERTGKGQDIQIPMFETMVQATLTEHMGGMTFEPQNGPPGYRRTLSKERRPYRTRDGYICVIVYNDRHWRSFLDLVGKSDLFDTDPRFADIGARTNHADELYAVVAEAIGTRTTAEWLEALRAADVPVAPLHTLASVFTDPHLAETGFFQMVDHPSEGRIRQIDIFSKWSESPPSIRRHAPRLGEHSIEVLLEAGLSRETIEQMIANSVTAQPN